MDSGFQQRLGRLTRGFLRRAAKLTPALLSPAVLPATGFAVGAAGTVSAVAWFGTNPGRLRMKLHVPPTPPRAGAPLLVLLHGCGQDAAQFAGLSGFMALADRVGAALLLPEQQAENNGQRCFNWFRPADTQRGSGEAASVREMVAEALRRCGADPGRVFVAGLSAGGALAAALLAAYPDVFAGGGVVAGLPVGAANSAGEALRQMQHPRPAPRAALVGRIPPVPGTHWPRLSVWHGTADHVVDPANADALVAQWTGLLGLPEAPDAETEPAPHIRLRRWAGSVEQWSIAGLGHAFPIAAGASADPFVLPAGIDAAAAMARFWGILPP